MIREDGKEGRRGSSAAVQMRAKCNEEEEEEVVG